MDNLTMLENLSQNWLDAKDAEHLATERRRRLEDKLLSLIGVAENMEGTESVETDGGYKIKITGRMTRKVNGERIPRNCSGGGADRSSVRACSAGNRRSI
jgi:hypothetical protein